MNIKKYYSLLNLNRQRDYGNLFFVAVIMAPTPQDPESSWNNKPSRNPDERIVISGISGVFPQSQSVKDFANILYSKVITLKYLLFILA